MNWSVRVHAERFDPGAELNAFTARNPNAGAIASFVGQMRDFSRDSAPSGAPISSMTLEYYPGMAEKQLSALLTEARERWPLDDASVIHRFGTLTPSEPIVFVATASAHRDAAFSACEFVMDWLKTKAPFWKKETTDAGGTWVAAHDGDTMRAAKWRNTKS
ncbi:MAG: molybdenum cofactor biosynthesis protein MoaE [Rhodobacteraceae bacterium]|nr:molybdenum cofactor biosynthesis protein MoaE [Paracoccaceae bacterium]